jgi:hypothetical protein
MHQKNNSTKNPFANAYWIHDPRFQPLANRDVRLATRWRVREHLHLRRGRIRLDYFGFARRAGSANPSSFSRWAVCDGHFSNPAFVHDFAGELVAAVGRDANAVRLVVQTAVYEKYIKYN